MILPGQQVLKRPNSVQTRGDLLPCRAVPNCTWRREATRPALSRAKVTPGRPRLPDDDHSSKCSLTTHQVLAWPRFDPAVELATTPPRGRLPFRRLLMKDFVVHNAGSTGRRLIECPALEDG
jgi:hypothetical protein